MPLFSVVIPLYNKAANIKETLESVLSQSIQDFEVILVDDGSIDDSLDIARSFSDDRIQIHRKHNEGVAIARNFGVDKAKADFLAFLDADDTWRFDHLEVLRSLTLKFTDHHWFSTSYEKKYSAGLVIPAASSLYSSTRPFEGPVSNYFEHSLIDGLTCASTACFKKQFFEVLGGFDTTMTHGEDTDLWIRAALRSPLVFSSRITAQYDLTSINRVSNLSLNDKAFLDLDRYEESSKKNIHLKRYLDLNRYSIGLEYKLAGDDEKAHVYFAKIDKNNLNSKQKVLLQSPKWMLKVLLSLQKRLRSLKINLTAFD